MTSKDTIPKTWKLLTPLLIFILLGFASEIAAQTLYVKRSGTKLQAADSAKSKVLAKLSQGTPAKVIKKGKKFYKVSAGGKTGWIFKFKLTAKVPENTAAGGGDLLDALGGRQKIAANEASSGSSIRGLTPVSEKYAKKKGISTAIIQSVKQMEAYRINPQELEKFRKEGRLGEYGQ